MSGKKSNSGKAGEKQPGGKPRALLCEQWEALLVDALDGTLGATESAAFYAHRDTCLACAQLLDESKRGSEWLHFLEIEPEVPADLISKILAKTSGAEDMQPAIVATGVPLAMPTVSGWNRDWTGGLLPMMEKHAAQSRWMMTAAMAFFSLAFTLHIMLNMTGMKLNSFRLADLKPTTLASGLKSQFYVANKNVMRYYDNVRFFYELESRVRELRRDAEPETPVVDGGAGASGDKKTGDQKPAAKHPGGSATVPAPQSQAEPVRHAEPVMARLERERSSTPLRKAWDSRLQLAYVPMEGVTKTYEISDDVTDQKLKNLHTVNGDRKNVDEKRSEGNLA